MNYFEEDRGKKPEKASYEERRNKLILKLFKIVENITKNKRSASYE
jgi:hypothetical protein